MVTVRVPATTANLGPGFDTLGLALALYNTLTFEELAEGLYFEGVDPEYATAENLAVVAYKAVLSKLGLPMPGLRISVQAEIPICRGLGSSAALIAAGAAGANANHGSPLTRAELLAVCEGMHYALVALHVRVQTAVAYERLGKHEDARAWLADALRDAEPDGLVMPFVENYGYLAPLLSREVRSGLTARIIELGEAVRDFAYAEELLARLPELDFVIGSVHMAGKKFHHKDLYYIEKADEAYYDSVIDSYLDSVLELARWGQFQVLGHLTLPLRYINEHHGEHMTFRRHMDRVEEIFRAVIPQGVGIECNTNRGNEPLPGPEILRLYRRLGGEIVTLGSDAHRPGDVGCFIRQRQELLRECGFRYFTTFEQGKPRFQAL